MDRDAPDLIINPAAYTAVDKAEDEPELAMRINAEAPAVIARWAAEHGVPLIHFSTDYVYDGSGDRPWREEDEPRPLGVYGKTKLAGENAVRAAGGAFLIFRTCWVYAARGKNFMRTIARLALERKELRIVGDQIGAPTTAALIADCVTKVVSGGLDELRARSAKANGACAYLCIRRDDLVRLHRRYRRWLESNEACRLPLRRPFRFEPRNIQQKRNGRSIHASI